MCLPETQGGVTEGLLSMSCRKEVKGLVCGNKSKANDAIDKRADLVESKTPDALDDKVEAAAKEAKEAVSKLKE